MPLKVGIVGCSGAVGQAMLDVLVSRKLHVSTLRLFANRAAGTAVDTSGIQGLGTATVTIEKFSMDACQGLHCVLLAVSGSFALENARAIAEETGAVVIDNSSAFRLAVDVPLVVPEVNGDAIREDSMLIANPNCTTAIAMMALGPLHQRYGVRAMLMSTYQAASGAGREGMDELAAGMAAGSDLARAAPSGVVDRSQILNQFFAHPLALNVIPHIDVFQPNGYSKEEMKVAWETRKILGVADHTDDAAMPISCTAVRVPTLRAHAETVVVDLLEKANVADVRKLLDVSPGVRVVDDIENMVYPMPIDCSGLDDVCVGRLRPNLVFANGLEMFVCGDQLLRGAALNAILIAERVAQQRGW